MKRKKAVIIIVFFVCSLVLAIGYIKEKQIINQEDPIREDVYTVSILAPLYASDEACTRISDEISNITMRKAGCKVEVKRNISVHEMKQFLVSDTKMDLFPCFPWDFSLPELAEKNKIIPITHLLREYGRETLHAVTEEDIACTTVDGEVYGIPINKDKAQGRGFLCVKDILDQLQIDYTQLMGYQELEEVFKKVKAKYPDMYPIVPSDGSIINPVWDVDMLGDGLGVLEHCLTNSTNVVNLYSCPSFVEYVTYMYQWVQRGYMMPNAVNTIESSNELIRSGIGFGTFSPYKEGIEQEESRNKGKQMVFIEMSEPYSTTDMVSSCWVISAKSEKPEMAMRVLNLMYTDPEISNILVNGTEGDNWVYKDESKQLICNSAAEGQMLKDYSVHGWIWPNEQITPIWEGQKEGFWKKLEKFNQEAKKSPAKGFIWNSKSVQRETVACKEIVDRYYNGLILGCIDPKEAIPKFNEELEQAGINKIIFEKQKQLDEWLTE